MKKGVSSLIAWVLLIGFAVTLAVFVSRWSLQLSQKTTEGTTEMIEIDIQCSNVAIQGICEGGRVKIKNRGTLTIVDFHKDGKFLKLYSEDEGLRPNKESDLLLLGTYTPVIKIDGKIVLCTSQKQTFEC